MFKRLNVNQYSGKVDLWESIEGRTYHRELEPDFTYYIPDKSGSSDIKDIYGNPVIKKTAKSFNEIKEFKKTGVKCCETDISPTTKFLQSYYKDQDLKVDMNNINICTLDIEISSLEFPDPQYAKYPIDLVTMHFSQSNRTVTLGLKEYTGSSSVVKEYYWIPDEKKLIETMIDIFRKEKVDIITGWYVETFDCHYIVNRSNILHIESNFSPLNKVSIREKEVAGQTTFSVKFDGITILDYMELYKKYTFESQETYTLQAISKLEIGEGKNDYEGVINDLSDRDWNGYVEYNVQDVLLVTKLERGNPDAKETKYRSGLKFIELAITMAYEARISFDDIFSQMAVLTGYILRYLHSENLVLPDKVYKVKDKLPGAYVFAKTGKFKNVISFDVESMYPSLIRSFNIGPDTIIVDPTEEEKKICYSTPLSEYKTWDMADGSSIHIGGIYYRKDKISVLNKIVSKIFLERKEFKNQKNKAKKEGRSDLVEYYDKQQMIRKILINSMYGVLGNEHFHLFNLNCATTITLGAQHLIKYLSQTTNDYFKNYFYLDTNYFPITDESNKLQEDLISLIDTDSNFFCFDELINKLNLKFNDNFEMMDWINKLDKTVIKPLFDDILKLYFDNYGAEGKINFKRDKTITDMLILAKKAYIMRVIDIEGETFNEYKLKITGTELKKKSTPKFCRDNLLKLVDKMFDVDKDIIIKEISNFKKIFKSVNINEISSLKGAKEYSKYAKDIGYYIKNGLDYTKGCPMQVRAAQNYNYTIAKYKLKLIPIGNGAKVRFIPIKNNNYLKDDIIGWIGSYPEEFKEIFKIDYDLQFEKTFLATIQNIFNIVNWGEINLMKSKMDKFLL